MVSYGDFFQFYINGILVWQGYDASLAAAASVGIGEYNDNSTGNSLHVDYAIGIPHGLGTDGADAAAEMPTDRLSEEQERLNSAANASPRGNVDRSSAR